MSVATPTPPVPPPAASRSMRLGSILGALAVGLPLGAAALARAVLPAFLELTPGGVVALEERLLGLAPVGTLVALVLTLRTEARLRPLVRAAARATREGIPPSQAAVADLRAAPVALLGWMVGGAAALAVADAAGLVPGSGIDPANRRAIAAGTFGLVALTAVAVAGLWTRALRAVLAPYPPELCAPPAGASHPKRQGLIAGVGVLAMGALALAAALALGGAHGLDRLPLGGGVAWVLLVAVVTAGAVHRHARREEDDIARLAARIEAADTPEDAVPAAREGAGTALGRRLGAAVVTFAQRYGDTGHQEEATRRSLEELLASKTRFMASMSHDLRSPLNSILGFSELLLSGADGPLEPGQQESLRVVQRSGRDLLELLNDVLDAARLDAGRMPLRRAWTPSVEILTEALGKGRELANERSIEVVAQLQPGLPPVFVDRDRVVQAVVCLFRHLARAMDGGVLQLFARVDDDGRGGQELRVDLVDQGGELRELDRERIFQAFQEVKGTGGRRIGGLGVSLSLARSLARAHGGDVWLETDPVRGTAFRVGLPLVGSPTVAGDPPLAGG